MKKFEFWTGMVVGVAGTYYTFFEALPAIFDLTPEPPKSGEYLNNLGKAIVALCAIYVGGRAVVSSIGEAKS